jgi:Transposase DDE domain
LIANAGSILVERSFADAANRHGFKRARWRGLIKQSIQDLLIATIQNLRKLVATTQNLPGKSWEALTRILLWSAVTLHTFFTSSPPRHLVLALS